MDSVTPSERGIVSRGALHFKIGSKPHGEEESRGLVLFTCSEFQFLNFGRRST